MKKTNRKNQTGLTVTWPEGFYTMETSTDPEHVEIPSLLQVNSHFAAKITLRVRLNNAIEDKSVEIIGTLKGGKGRPKLVFANTPVSNETIELARKVKNMTITKSTTPSVVKVIDIKPNPVVSTTVDTTDTDHQETSTETSKEEDVVSA